MLFEPLKVKTLTLHNRIVMPPMCTCLASINGEVTKRLIDYYVERSKGGVGLIIIEATNIDFPQGSDQYNKPTIDSDKYIAGLNELVEAIHLYGSKVAIQLHHAGRQTTPVYTEGKQPVSASDITCKVTGIKPRSLTITEIKELIEKFSEGARRAKEAGFDAVEIHGAHGYLISQFLSPYTNKREDEYGKNFEGRLKFPLEIIKDIRQKVGDDFPLIFRINGDDYIEEGLRLKDTNRHLLPKE